MKELETSEYDGGYIVANLLTLVGVIILGITGIAMYVAAEPNLRNVLVPVGIGFGGTIAALIVFAMADTIRAILETALNTRRLVISNQSMAIDSDETHKNDE